jgi:hypothetical protein
MLTPANPVSYGSSRRGVSNGYGTLAQGNWSRQEPILGVRCSGALAMARVGSEIALLFQPDEGAALSMTLGAYR